MPNDGGGFQFAVPPPRVPVAGAAPGPLMPPPPPKQNEQQEPQEQPPTPPLPFDPPGWSRTPTSDYFFEVLKNGSILEQTPVFRQPFVVVGRLPICDIDLEHPSVSRYHAIIQFKDDDTVHLYDLGSSHGTFLNKTQLAKREFTRVRVGDMVRFGQSSRLYILMGPRTEEVEEEPIRKRMPAQSKAPIKPESNLLDRQEATWGFAEDAYEGDDIEGHPFDATDIDQAKTNEDAYYYADPRKALRVWLEGRGSDLTIHTEEEGHGATRGFLARIEFPVQTSSGNMTISATGHGLRKKHAEKEACLDACVKLDQIGVLRVSRSEATVQRRQHLRDLYDQSGDNDDTDTFYDRTTVDKSADKSEPGAIKEVETYESLTAKRVQVLDELAVLEKEDNTDQSGGKHSSRSQDDDVDELDKYMSKLQDGIRNESLAIRQKRMHELKVRLARLDKLIALAAPSTMLVQSGPRPVPATSAVSSSGSSSRLESAVAVALGDAKLASPQKRQPDADATASSGDIPKRRKFNVPTFDEAIKQGHK